MDAFRAEVAEWMRRHGEQWIGGETFRTLALTEWRGWTEGMSLAEEQKQWKKYLAGVSEARHGQWGDNCTIVAISGLLKRMVVVLSVGASKKLSLFEIEPPDHLSDGESSGVPLILSHFGDHHYMPVRVKRDGPWGWVLNDVPKAKELDVVPVSAGSSEDAVPHQGLMSCRIPFSQRRSDLLSFGALRAPRNIKTFESDSPMSGRISSPQRRLVLKDLARRSSFRSREGCAGTGSYAGAMMVGRTLSVERWFAERAVSLGRGADSEEEWSSAWGIDKKEKDRRVEWKEEGGSYAGSMQVVGCVQDVRGKFGGVGDGGQAR